MVGRGARELCLASLKGCFNGEVPEEAKKVRDIVLGLLKNEGKITEVQYQAALAEPIVTRTRCV